MARIVNRTFHKLTTEHGIVHEEDVAIDSIPEGVKAFLDQFEGDNRSAAALMIAATAAQDVQEGVGMLSWAENPEVVASLAQAREGLETVAEVAQAAEQLRDTTS